MKKPTKSFKSDKNQTLVLIGIALLAAAGIMFYIAASQPSVYESTQTVTVKSETQKVILPVNINTATAEELMAVDGIGAEKAAAIVEYRGVIGGYESVEQIKEIKGFSDGVFNRIAPYLTV